MAETYRVQGVLLNYRDTAASVTMEISPPDSGLTVGSITGTVRFFSNNTFRRFKFHSGTPVKFRPADTDSSPSEVLFENVTLEDVINKTASTGGQATLKAARAGPGTWSGSYSITCPDGKKLTISGRFSGTVETGERFSKRSIKGAGSKIPVIVQLSAGNNVSGSGSRKMSSRKMGKQEISRTLVIKVKYNYNMIGAFSARVNEDELRQLMEHDDVHIIWHDKKFRGMLDISAPVIKAPPVWNLGNHGKGIGIAVLDTGIYPHPDLTTPVNRIVAFKDYVNRKTWAYDDNGHGTHVAGCAAGNGARSKGRYTGSAPKANLVGLKVLDKHGSGNLSDILAAIQFVIDNRKKFNIKVMNLSLGATGKHSYKNDPLCQAAEKAWAAGIVVCAAAGNSGPGSGTVSTPGIDPVIITVGAENTRRTIRINDDIIARFSGRGPTADRLTKPDVVAPGVNIISLRAPGSTADKQQAGSRVGKSYFVLSGTSMATPICSGIAALMIHKKPGITPDAVKRALKATARKIGSYSPNAQGNGLVDAQSAVTG